MVVTREQISALPSARPAARPRRSRRCREADPPPRRLSQPKRNNRRRYILMASVPVILLLVGGYFWLSGGRYASTDNAYVQQDRVTVTAQVSGRIVDAPVMRTTRSPRATCSSRSTTRPTRSRSPPPKPALASARLQVEELRAAENAAVAAVQMPPTDDVAFNQKAFDRQQGLLQKGVASQAGLRPGRAGPAHRPTGAARRRRSASNPRFPRSAATPRSRPTSTRWCWRRSPSATRRRSTLPTPP